MDFEVSKLANRIEFLRKHSPNVAAIPVLLFFSQREAAQSWNRLR